MPFDLAHASDAVRSCEMAGNAFREQNIWPCGFKIWVWLMENKNSSSPLAYTLDAFLLGFTWCPHVYRANMSPNITESGTTKSSAYQPSACKATGLSPIHPSSQVPTWLSWVIYNILSETTASVNGAHFPTKKKCSLLAHIIFHLELRMARREHIHGSYF